MGNGCNLKENVCNFSDGNVGNSKYVFSYLKIQAKFSIYVWVRQELKIVNYIEICHLWFQKNYGQLMEVSNL